MGGLLVRSEQQLGLTRSRRGGAGVTSEASDRATPPVTYSDPNGRTVILSEATWAHITSGHPELVQMLDRLRAAVEHPSRTLPGRTAGDAMTVTLGSTTFARVDYDADADVLYLHVGDPDSATDFEESPEGHAIRFDALGRLVGVTVVGAKSLIEQGGRLVVTGPERLELSATELRSIIQAA